MKKILTFAFISCGIVLLLTSVCLADEVFSLGRSGIVEVKSVDRGVVVVSGRLIPLDIESDLSGVDTVTIRVNIQLINPTEPPPNDVVLDVSDEVDLKRFENPVFLIFSTREHGD